MRRYVGCHANGNAARPVEQQIGQHGGEHLRLLQAIIEVRSPLYRVLIDIPQHGLGDSGQTCLGIPHRGRAVAIHRAEVALPIDQRITQTKVLCHARHRVVDSRVPVWVILAQHLTDDTCALLVRRVGLQSHVVHCIEDAPMNRLHPIPRVRQGTRHDYAHRIVEVARPHLIFDGNSAHGTHKGAVPVRVTLQRPIPIQFRIIVKTFPVAVLGIVVLVHLVSHSNVPFHRARDLTTATKP